MTGGKSYRLVVYVILAVVIIVPTLALLPWMYQKSLVSRHERWWQEDARVRKTDVLDLDAFNARISAWNDLLDSWARHPDGPAARYCLEHLESGNAFSDEAFNAVSWADSKSVSPIPGELRAKLVKMSKNPETAPKTVRGGPVVME